MHTLNIPTTGVNMYHLGLELEGRGYTEDCPSKYRAHYRKVTKKGIRFMDFCFDLGKVVCYTIQRYKK